VLSEISILPANENERACFGFSARSRREATAIVIASEHEALPRIWLMRPSTSVVAVQGWSDRESAPLLHAMWKPGLGHTTPGDKGLRSRVRRGRRQ